MRGAGPVAALVMYTVDPGGLKLAARRGPQRVDDAANVLADRAMQRDAARRLLLGAAHDGVVRRELRRQMRRREAAGARLGLAPIERGPEVGAAGAAGDARDSTWRARLHLARELAVPAERVREPHLLRRAAVGLEQARAADEDAERLRARRRDVQAGSRCRESPCRAARPRARTSSARR